MVSEKNIVLTDTKRNLIRGEYEGSRQGKNDHKSSIRDNVHGVLGDFQFLFEHSDDEVLEYMFQEDHTPESGPINSLDTHNPVGFGQLEFLTESVDSDGRPRDPEHNPDAKTRFEWLVQQDFGPSKASPETQERLIDCIAFLCRAAEMGLLNPRDLLEQGMERYYSQRAERVNRASEQLVKVSSETPEVLRNRVRQQDKDLEDLTPLEQKVIKGND